MWSTFKARHKSISKVWADGMTEPDKKENLIGIIGINESRDG